MDKYFHVLVKMNKAPEKLIFLFGDLTEKELKSRFIKPYKRKETLVRGNDLIALSDVSAVHIVRTKKKKDVCLKELQVSSGEQIDEMNKDSDETGVVIISAGSGWEDEDIVEVGEDVTNHYIHGGCQGDTWFNKIANNQWTIALGTGLILLLLGAFFHLN